MSTINDNGITYLHPSVTSIINSEEVTYQGKSGIVKLFCALTSEKGVDNKTELITSSDEFIFKYGKPNMKKYGQSSYNVIRWLNAGGEAYILRLLPENAGYAHAYLNIQTKKTKKKVLDVNGAVVEVDNVHLKPVITYASVNNSSEDLLFYELEKDRTEPTVDNFTNNFLFVLYPTGRGKSYNNLGFRISLNTSFDSTEESRIYNLEIITFDEYDTANLLEGPFYVSLDPDTLSNSNESMFIEDVINKYSKHVRCKFNVDAYNYITNLVNPNVNPKILDILTGKSRDINGKPESYFNTITNKYEDVHMSLHKYDREGKVIKENEENSLNFPDSSDQIENSIIVIDNKIRDQKFEAGKKSLKHMKDSLNSILDDTFVEKLTSIINGLDDLTSVTADDPSCLVYQIVEKLTKNQEEIEEYYSNTFMSNKSDETFYKFNALINNFESISSDLNEQCLKVTDFCKTVTDDLGNIGITNVELTNSEYVKELNNKEVINITAISHKGNLNKINNNILEYKVGRVIGEEIDGIKLIATDIGNEHDFITYNLVPTVYKSGEDPSITIKDNLTFCTEKYNETIDMIFSLEGGYIPETSTQAIKVKIYSNFEDIIEKLYSIIIECLGDMNYKVMNKIYSKLLNSLVPTVYSLKKNECKSIGPALSQPTEKNNIIKRTKTNIDLTTAKYIGLNSIIYTNSLHNFNLPVKFANGSDGDFDDSVPVKERLKNINDYLIRAYKGLIDNNITNKKIYPFEHILDANYSVEVKNAIVDFVRDIRKDMFCWLDDEFHSTPEQTLQWRRTSFTKDTNLAALFAQHFTVYDEFTGKDINVGFSYFLAQKIPEIASQHGLHYTVAGPRRGIIDGFKSISYVPNETYKEQMFINKINYIESDIKRTKLGSQQTLDSKNSPLSKINNVLTLLDIKRNLEYLVEDYQFEFEDSQTINKMNFEINNYLSKYLSNRSCEEISARVFASEYDKQQNIIRVTVTIKFTNTIERIVISLDVVK